MPDRQTEALRYLILVLGLLPPAEGEAMHGELCGLVLSVGEEIFAGGESQLSQLS